MDFFSAPSDPSFYEFEKVCVLFIIYTIKLQLSCKLLHSALYFFHLFMHCKMKTGGQADLNTHNIMIFLILDLALYCTCESGGCNEYQRL